MGNGLLEITSIKCQVQPGALYLVGTPIGNLDDMSFRGVATLNGVDKIVSESPATTRKLLSHFGISVPLSTYHEHLQSSGPKRVIDWIKEGKSVALVSEAGMPCLADPGTLLVHQCHEEGIPVIAIPGPNAAITAIALSGISSSTFTITGFIPRKKEERRHFLETLATYPYPFLFYESPRRLLETLKELAAIAGDRVITICRELTKKFEEVQIGTAKELIDHFQNISIKGELALVVAPCLKSQSSKPLEEQEEEVNIFLKELLAKGVSRSEAARKTALHFGLSKRKAYILAHKVNG